MLEIYNEQVRDLLNPQGNKKGGLKIRQHPKKGFYPQGLKIIPVVSYEDIEDRMEEGTQNRTVAATNMNATSRYELLSRFSKNPIRYCMLYVNNEFECFIRGSKHEKTV
jgi:hypothetical protein